MREIDLPHLLVASATYVLGQYFGTHWYSVLFFIAGKSPSQRMYNTLYVRWTQLTDKSEPFDVYYANQMNKIIAMLKQDLPGRP